MGNLNALFQEWISVFGKNVNQLIMEKCVMEEGNMLWHIFTWGCVECIEGALATKNYEELSDEEVIFFAEHLDASKGNVEIRKKPSLKELEETPYRDIYITAKDYSWTYVKTHEVGIGPFFATKEAKVNKVLEKRSLKALGIL